MAHFVLEIGVEEMPARFLAPLEEELVQRFTEFFREEKLVYGQVRAFSTPRRLTLDITELSMVQPTEEVLIAGPPARIAFDAQGQPTKAGLGFARSQDVEFSQIFVQQTDKGEYLAVMKKIGGQKAGDLLAKACPSIIAALSFPKKMHWLGKDVCTFGRPVRWLLALLDAQLIPFSFAGLTSGKFCYGHRVMGPGPWEVPHADLYAQILAEKGQVLLDKAARRALIREQGNALARDVQGTVAWSEILLDQVVNLVEAPVPVLGSFAAKFLELPAEVLLTSMEVHQKSFGIRGQDGKLLPYFLTAANIASKQPEFVRKGWERVLRARLEDARFFWEADGKTSFTTWLEKLDSVVFIGPLGSMGDKTRRLQSLCAFLAEIFAPDKKKALARAGRLSKADLVSEMVFEFDDLQGQMGGIYARLQGEGEDVATALYEQYLPAGQDSSLPESRCGAVLSLADKLDNLTGCFGLGMMPTGTADPYALRRNALGVCRLVLDMGQSVSLRALLTAAQKQYAGVDWKIPPADALQKLEEFFAQRLKAYWAGQGASTLVLDAAMAVGIDDMVVAEKRVRALEVFSQEPDFEDMVLTFKRAANILRKQEGVHLDGQVQEDLLQDVVEQDFWGLLQSLEPRWMVLAQEQNYTEMLVQLREVRPVLDAFFEGVMVMCDDQDVRRNRMNLLHRLVQALSRLADFGKFQV